MAFIVDRSKMTEEGYERACRERCEQEQREQDAFEQLTDEQLAQLEQDFFIRQEQHDYKLNPNLEPLCLYTDTAKFEKDFLLQIHNKPYLAPILHYKILIECTYLGNFELVKFLVEEKGVSYQYPDHMPLIKACEGGHLNVVKYLVSKYDDLSFCDAKDHLADMKVNREMGETFMYNALGYAAANNHKDVIQFLFELPGYIKAIGKYNYENTFMVAALNNNVEVLDYLIEQDSNLQYSNRLGKINSVVISEVCHYLLLKDNVKKVIELQDHFNVNINQYYLAQGFTTAAKDYDIVLLKKLLSDEFLKENGVEKEIYLLAAEKLIESQNENAIEYFVFETDIEYPTEMVEEIPYLKKCITIKQSYDKMHSTLPIKEVIKTNKNKL